METIIVMQMTNSVGLAFDILGFILLFLYGWPTQIATTSEWSFRRIPWRGKTKESRNRRKCQRFSWAGLIFVITGFILQLVSTWMA